MIIDLNEARRRSGAHNCGYAICISCKHEWVAVSPAGRNWLSCPKCWRETGVFKFPFSKVDDLHWTCDCGNDLFNITPDGAYCPNCGQTIRSQE